MAGCYPLKNQIIPPIWMPGEAKMDEFCLTVPAVLRTEDMGKITEQVNSV